MDRDQARTDYRRILVGVVRHHQALDRHITGAAMARVARRLGLRVKGGIIEAGDDEMARSTATPEAFRDHSTFSTRNWSGL